MKYYWLFQGVLVGILLAVCIGGCVEQRPAAATDSQIFRIVRHQDGDSMWDGATVFLSVRTNKCYIGAYKMGLLEVGAEECAPK